MWRCISFWFDFAFSWYLMMWSIFSCVYWSFYIFFGEKSIQVLCAFLNCCFLLLGGRSSLYILDINPLSDMWFANIFNHSVGCRFTLLIVPYDTENFYILMKSNLLFCCCCCLWLWSDERNHCWQCHLDPMTCSFYPVFSSKDFIASTLTFRSLIHFELIFVYGIG